MKYLEFLCRHHTKSHRMNIPSFRRLEGPTHIHLIRVFSGRALTLTRPLRKKLRISADSSVI